MLPRLYVHEAHKQHLTLTLATLRIYTPTRWGTCVGNAVAQARPLLHAVASALASSDWGMRAHAPSPWKRHPWYEHSRVPSSSIRPSACTHHRH